MNRSLSASIFILWLVFILVPSFHARIHSDEVLYWYHVREFALRGVPLDRVPLTHMLAAPGFYLSDHLFTTRVFNAIMVLLTMLSIMKFNMEEFGEAHGFLGPILFLSSYSTLRWGVRFNLESTATLLFVLGILSYRGKKVLSASFLFTASALCRETFIPPLFVFFILTRRDKKIAPIIMTSLITMCSIITFYNIQCSDIHHTAESAKSAGITPYTTLVSNIYSVTDFLFLKSNLLKLLHSSIEYLFSSPLLFLGFLVLYSEKHTYRRICLLIGTLIVSIMLTPGFINNGPFERYTLGPNALLCLLAPTGLEIYWTKMINKKRRSFFFVCVGISIGLIIIFNIGTALLSHIGATSVYDFGYQYDHEIISLLNKEATGEVLYGPHSPMIETARDWFWPDRDIGWAIEQEPDWLITYTKWIEITNPDVDNVTIYRRGLYSIIHSHPPGIMHKAITAVNNKPFWKGRGELD